MTAMERVECVVVGAGVVGLAIARRLAQSGREVILLEAADAIGTGTSSRNSEVIHAGIYYPTGSLRARLCVAGRDALYEYCRAHGVEHRRVGKLIVASDDSQLPKLEAIRAQAFANGVTDLRPIDAAAAKDLEPNLRVAGALVSPSTGIIDSHGLMLALLGDAEDAGAMLALLSPLERSHRAPDGFVLEVGGAEPMRLGCATLVNAAGLGAWAVAAGLEGFPADRIPPRVLAKGSYYALGQGRSPFSRLVYPVPVDGGLGVHLTLDLAGQARFGPDVEWLGDPATTPSGGGVDYAVDPARAESFYDSVRAYWPGLPDGALVPAYSGVRPKLSGPGQPQRDFLLQGPESHGIPGLVNLFGIESPGLTSCLAIADAVVGLVGVVDP
jgi:L-2-hydroxyglutarate oxidase LhgO